jgi:hypothetical protein
MAIKNRFIPFKFTPAAWGLVGRAFDEAEAYYSLDGEDLERRLIDVKATTPQDRDLGHLFVDQTYGKISDYDFEVKHATILADGPVPARRMLEIERKYGKIDPWEYDCAIAELDFPDKESMEQQTALLTADYVHGKIEKLEFDKTMAIAKDEPWVGIVDNGFDPEDGVNGLYFELDWNDQWVDHLRKHGYIGVSDEQIVEQWFSDVCRSQAADNPPEPDSPVPFNSGRVINRRRSANGTEYS